MFNRFVKIQVAIAIWIGLFVLYAVHFEKDVSAQVNFFDSGITSITDSVVDVTTVDTWVRRLHCNNTTGGAVTLTIEDGNDVDYFTAVSLAAGTRQVKADCS